MDALRAQPAHRPPGSHPWLMAQQPIRCRVSLLPTIRLMRCILARGRESSQASPLPTAPLPHCPNPGSLHTGTRQLPGSEVGREACPAQCPPMLWGTANPGQEGDLHAPLQDAVECMPALGLSTPMPRPWTGQSSSIHWGGRAESGSQWRLKHQGMAEPILGGQEGTALWPRPLPSVYAPLSRHTSLTEHKFKYKIIKNFKTAVTEHYTPSTWPFYVTPPPPPLMKLPTG